MVFDFGEFLMLIDSSNNGHNTDPTMGNVYCEDFYFLREDSLKTHKQKSKYPRKSVLPPPTTPLYL